jgi:hypothetical protein
VSSVYSHPYLRESVEPPPSAPAFACRLHLESVRSHAAPQPLSVGIPCRKGRLREPFALELCRSTGESLASQTQILARWPDKSVKWLLVDAIVPETPAGRSVLHLQTRERGRKRETCSLACRESSTEIRIDTGPAVFAIDRRRQRLLDQVMCAGRNLLAPDGVVLEFRDSKGRVRVPMLEDVCLERKGPVRATLRLGGRLKGSPCLWRARLCFYAGLGLVRCRLTLHNPRRARHRGGLWDLGDPGSVLFRELAVCLHGMPAKQQKASWITEPGVPAITSDSAVEIYQDSSGGMNWQSRNHVDRAGKIPCSFQGFRVRTNEGDTFGKRATPVVALQMEHGGVVAAFPEFWQQFPKAIEAGDGQLRFGVFPRQHAGLHELQGGEQKTQALWLDFTANAPGIESLLWVHHPARLLVDPNCCADSGAAPYLSGRPETANPSFTWLLEEAVDPLHGLAAQREVIDEYGWRNYGDLYADHEAAYFVGGGPLISHYNNQYDVLLGALLQYLRTGDPQWWGLADPLARHVIDIDIYHTQRDRSAYNGGLFWHTDHYRTAATATHRCYSAANQAPNGKYGGGPGNEHNYTTGLLLYYYLTGDPEARDAVCSLADWVVAMDDGERDLLGILDDGPTGRASCTAEPGYHGPGRGCGNSINALLDAWQLTGSREYLRHAETLLQRTIHPADDIGARRLLDAERRWSYTVFLSVVCRYLDLKAQEGEIDYGYSYARAALLHYARWMALCEVPYLSAPEKLEYPTETWAAQELRKANVMRLAAAHADQPLRSLLLERGNAFSARAWSDLFSFDAPANARVLAIVLVEGLKDEALSAGPVHPRPRPATTPEFGHPVEFVPQRQRIMTRIKTPRGLAVLALRLLNPLRCWSVIKARRTPAPRFTSACEGDRNECAGS